MQCSGCVIMVILFSNMKGIVYGPYDKGGLEGPPTKIPETSVGMMKVDPM